MEDFKPPRLFSLLFNGSSSIQSIAYSKTTNALSKINRWLTNRKGFSSESSIGVDLIGISNRKGFLVNQVGSILIERQCINHKGFLK